MGGVIIPDPDGGLVTLHGVDSGGVARKARCDGSGRAQTVFAPDPWLEGGSVVLSVGGAYQANMSAVAAGRVCVLTCVCALRHTTAGQVRINLWVGGVQRQGQRVASLTVNDSMTLDGQWVVGSGDWARISFQGCVAGDSIEWSFAGYTCEVA